MTIDQGRRTGQDGVVRLMRAVNRCMRGSRISARGGRQGIDDLIWDGDERFLTYANTYLQLFKMFIAILCLNGVEQPFKGHQCPFFLPLRRRNPSLRHGSLHPRGGRRTQRPPPPPGSAPEARGMPNSQQAPPTVDTSQR